jgi:cysteine desulfurase/selenocysteine lyase
LYCRKSATEFLIPPSIGGESATLSKQKVIAYLESPQRFQAGFRNYPGVAGMESSLRYILRIGITNIRKRNIKIGNMLRNELVKIPNVKIYGPEHEDSRTSIVSFSPFTLDSKIVVNKLEQNGIVFAERQLVNGRKIVRGSPHFFNSQEEVLNAISHIKNILK